ncbi:MAG TPA: hypothetical protein VK395_15390 [Gemmataceae bacterium]|nr:hypothetical protein [Gemmataceae bacterium]
MPESKKSIREQFGIDFLLGQKEAAKATPFSAPAGESMGLVDKAKQVRLMAKVLKPLGAAPDAQCHLADLMDPTGLDLPDLLKVEETLEKNQLVTVVSRDRLGNHLIQITPQGREFLEDLNI